MSPDPLKDVTDYRKPGFEKNPLPNFPQNNNPNWPFNWNSQETWNKMDVTSKSNYLGLQSNHNPTPQVCILTHFKTFIFLTTSFA